MKTKTSFFVLSILLMIVFSFSATLLWEMAVYSRLDVLNQNVNQQWAQTERAYQLQTRIVPYLLKIMKENPFFEKSEIDELADAHAWVERTHIKAKKATKDVDKLAEFEKAQASLSDKLERLFIIVEYDSDLKNNKKIAKLKDQFEKTEDKISARRNLFNKAVHTYNSAFKLIPGASLLKILGQRKKPLLTMTDHPHGGNFFESDEPAVLND